MSSKSPLVCPTREIGFFMGAVGTKKTILVKPQDCEMHLPSDLSGLRIETYRERSDGNLEAALGKVCTRIEDLFAAVGQHGQGGDVAQVGAQGEGVPTPRSRRRRSLGIASQVTRAEAYQIVNISETGAFLETNTGPVPLSTPMTLDLNLDGRVAPVRASVVRVQEPDWGKVGGIGVRFVDVPTKSRDLIRRYVYTKG